MRLLLHHSEPLQWLLPKLPRVRTHEVGMFVAASRVLQLLTQSQCLLIVVLALETLPFDEVIFNMRLLPHTFPASVDPDAVEAETNFATECGRLEALRGLRVPEARKLML